MLGMAARPILNWEIPCCDRFPRRWAQVSEAATVLRDLRDTLHEFQRTHGFGRGISAVQIGELKRLLYIEFEGRSYCMHNPD